MDNPTWEEKAKQSLFYIGLGKWMEKCVSEVKAETIKQGMHNEAVSLIAQIYSILQDKQCSDRDCMEQIESILMAYAQHLALDSTRHIEQD